MNAWIKRTINRLGNWLFGPPVPPIAEFNKLVELGRLGGWAMIERHLWSEDARTRYIAMFRAYEYADTGDESLIESLDAKNRQLAKEMLLPIVMREKREREEAIASLRETVKAIEEVLSPAE